MPNLYEILTLDTDATQSDIRSAYREIVKQVHPDVGGDAEDFAVVQNAYDTLSDAKKKKRYDASLKVSSKSKKPDTKADPPDWYATTSGSYVPRSYGVDQNDFIRDCWAQVSQQPIYPFGSQGNSRGTQRQPKTATIQKNDIVGGTIQRSPDFPMSYGVGDRSYSVPVGRTTANIDVALNGNTDHLRTLLPGDRVFISYDGIDINMTVVSLVVRSAYGKNIVISLELEK
jgi:curved DNA-binding protein CbpA